MLLVICLFLSYLITGISSKDGQFSRILYFS
uniref:Uncharacterized protein n=1 Tax=Arundo donax TaxID=35708 RepID=A0A0A8YUB3_ARUDO